MTVPRITVITCCYNSSAYLRESLDSIRRQTWTDFEHLLIDDGSTDDSPALIADFARSDPRVRVFPKANEGLTASLNFAVTRARAPILANLDADDIAAPERLARQIEALGADSRRVLIGTGFHEIDAGGIRSRTFTVPTAHTDLVRRIETFRSYFPHSSVLFTREAFDRAGGYNPRFRKSQDCDLWLRLARHGELAGLPEPLTSLRKHAGSVSFSRSGYPQRVYGFAAIISHFRRQWGATDLTRGPEEAWQRFLAWISRQLARYEPADTAALQSDLKAFLAHPGPAALVRLAPVLAAPLLFPRFVLQKSLEAYLPVRLARRSLAVFPKNVPGSPGPG